MQSKRCPSCKGVKPVAEFMSSTGKTRYGYCVSCMREHQKGYRTNFENGTPVECEICGVTFDDIRVANRDHCHDSGEFRGWLCRECNIGIGMFRNNVDFLSSTIEYLEKNMTDIMRCVCGRNASRVHCPACGRFACYAKSSKARIEETMTGPIMIMTYHCRGCGIDFNDLQRAKCEAPQQGLSITAQRIVDKVTPAFANLSYDERLAKARELLSKAKPKPRGEQE